MSAVAVLCIPSSAIVSLTKAFRAVLGMHRQAVNLVGVLFSLRYIVIEFRAMVRCAVAAGGPHPGLAAYGSVHPPHGRAPLVSGSRAMKEKM